MPPAHGVGNSVSMCECSGAFRTDRDRLAHTPRPFILVNRETLHDRRPVQPVAYPSDPPPGAIGWGRRRDRHAGHAPDPARPAGPGEARPDPSGHRRAGVLRLAVPQGRADSDRRHQRLRRHQIDGRREDRADLRRCAGPRRDRLRPGGPDGGGGGIGLHRLLLQHARAGGDADGGEVQPAVLDRQRHHRQPDDARPEERVPDVPERVLGHQ